jgi:chromosome segregation ATPase
MVAFAVGAQRNSQVPARVTSITSIQVFQLLLELVQRITELQEDPKALENAAKEAFALSEYEQGEADKARSQIDTNRTILEDITQRQNELTKALKKHEDDKADHTRNVAAFREKEKELKQALSKANERERAAEDELYKLTAREKNLKDAELLVEKKLQEAALKLDEASQVERIIKEKTEKLKDLFGK